MPAFLIIAGLVALLSAALVAWPLLIRRGRGLDGAEADQQIFRDQLSEVDRDLARGTISAAEAEGARIEVSRRLLAAAARAETEAGLTQAPRTASRIAAVIAALAIPAGALALYADLGAPGLPDQPLAARQTVPDPTQPSQAEAEVIAADALAEQPMPTLDPEFAAMLARLEEIVAGRPDDIAGNRLLARTLARAGRWVDARVAYDHLMGLLGDNASPDELAGYAEAMVFAAGGYVSPEASAVITSVLRQDPAHEMARYYGGFALRQAGRFDAAIAVWQSLLDEDRAAAQPRGPGWREALAELIAETRGTGPTQEQVEDAAQLSPEERAAQIEAMVVGLEERLTTSGGEAEEWVQLIRAYAVLDRPQDALRIYGLSQQALTSEGGAGFVREQTLLMGLEIE